MISFHALLESQYFPQTQNLIPHSEKMSHIGDGIWFCLLRNSNSSLLCLELLAINVSLPFRIYSAVLYLHTWIYEVLLMFRKRWVCHTEEFKSTMFYMLYIESMGKDYRHQRNHFKREPVQTWAKRQSAQKEYLEGEGRVG